MIPSSPNLSTAPQFRDLPKWLWLWVPLIYVTLHYTLAGISEEVYAQYMGRGEFGNNELMTMSILALAIAIGLNTLWIMRGMGDWRLWIWIFLGTLGCIYFGGEEASWGQHLIGWESSEAWQEFNDQQETNLHNSDKYGPLLDQLPRNLITLGMLVGGVFAPIWRRLKNLQLNPANIHFWIWPTVVCLPTGLIGATISGQEPLYEALMSTLGLEHTNIPTGEIKEWYAGFFLMIYLASFNLRFRQIRSAQLANEQG